MSFGNVSFFVAVIIVSISILLLSISVVILASMSTFRQLGFFGFVF